MHFSIYPSVPRFLEASLGEFLLVWQRVNASDCASKGNLEMQYSTIFPDEGNDGVCERRKRAPQKERATEREKESQTFTTTQYWSSDIVLLSSIFSRSSSVLRLRTVYSFHSTRGSYLTTVICISILLKKISNKVRAGGDAAPPRRRIPLHPLPPPAATSPRPSEIHTFKSRSTGRTVCTAEVRTSRWTAVSFRGRS